MKKEKQITENQLKTILGKDFTLFMEKIISNCFCGDCGETTIIDYKIFVNDLYDAILRGKCKKCEKIVGRYVEIGEDEECVRKCKKIIKNL